ncbi:hypothetical protein DEVEQU_03834 [Devosia equisanguinis]|uniref:DUF5330 domain-containing protein n=1 Tax=Devosia equisanguinis TaxID=2490941 RepID=A0A3S4GMT2_9HYPH|nr:hypothetical protein [Devosia equisanguinis]VDS06670.1 hypothetical protein DEVEQU_03834 [Devosia equisanguinis]
MFLLRSAFWLTLAFLVIKPEMDVRESASALSAQAMAQGSQFIASQIEQIECTDLTCIGGKAIAAAALKPSASVEKLSASAAPRSAQAGDDMQTSPAASPVPFPRPRPEWAG